MAETCIICIRDLSSRALQKRVRGFLAGGKVSVEDDTGRTFEVVCRKNRVILRCSGDDHHVEYFGKGDSTGVFLGHFLY